MTLLKLPRMPASCITSWRGRPLRRLSEQALQEKESHARVAASTTASAPRARAQLDVEGRSYLLPTVTIRRDQSLRATSRVQRVPVVLDLLHVSSDGSPHSQPMRKPELRAQMEQLQRAGFTPIGVTNASEDVKKAAAALQLPYLISTRSKAHTESEREHCAELTDSPLEVTSEASSESSASAAAAALEEPMVVTASVRSGQQVYAQNRSLIVLGNVNSGAEVLADGDIFVLGALKGRALAGIGGNVDTTISCQSFDAELISIAHHFTTCDELETHPDLDHDNFQLMKPTRICLRDDRLSFQSATQ